MTFEDWKIELAIIVSKDNNISLSGISINDITAMEFYENGVSPEMAYAEIESAFKI